MVLIEWILLQWEFNTIQLETIFYSFFKRTRLKNLVLFYWLKVIKIIFWCDTFCFSTLFSRFGIRYPWVRPPVLLFDYNDLLVIATRLSQKFCNILICASYMYITWLKQFELWKVLTMVSSRVVVGALRYCVLLHSVCDLKAILMNVLCSLIWELMLYKFKLSNNTVEVTKNFCWVKGEAVFDHSTVADSWKFFYLGCKNLHNQARLYRTKTMDFGTMLQAIKANPMSNT